MISARLGMELINAGHWIIEHGSEMPIPLLLIQGTAERIVNPEGTLTMAKKLPNTAIIKIWEGDYHELHNEPDKETVLKYELAWIKKHLTAKVQTKKSDKSHKTTF